MDFEPVAELWEYDIDNNTWALISNPHKAMYEGERGERRGVKRERIVSE